MPPGMGRPLQGAEMGPVLRVLRGFGATAGVMIARNWGKVVCFTFLARQAALQGAVVSGAYALTFQLGFATSQIAESLATSTQVLLAQSLRGESDSFCSRRVAASHVVKRGLQLGLGLSVALAAATVAGQRGLLGLMTSDGAVRATAAAAMPWVLAAQAMKAMAYPTNGALMGAQDWRFSAVALWAAGLVGILSFEAASALAGPSAATGLRELWAGLLGFFGSQLLLGLARIRSGQGPWSALR